MGTGGQEDWRTRGREDKGQGDGTRLQKSLRLLKSNEVAAPPPHHLTTSPFINGRMIKPMLNIRLFVLLALGLVLYGCDLEQEFVSGDSVEIGFSTDTLRFDTVFVERGSATRSFRIYNRGDEPVQIDRIYVEGRSGVRYQINVDGVAGPVVENAVIWGNDSIHVFVEVTVDPTMPESVSPYVAEDLLIFETGDRSRTVHLEAWGQNANYFPSRFNKGVAVVLSCENGVTRWDSELPYVLFGEIFIENCTLEIAPGTRIYVHGGIARNELFGVFNDGFLYTLETGSLHILGTPEEPVIITTDRLEPEFQDEAGQWFGIVLGAGSRGNRIENCRIYHPIFGLYVDSTAEVTLSQTEIAYTASSALIGRQADIRADNCLFYRNGSNAVQTVLGGNLEMNYCTVANYGVDAAALALQNFQDYDTDADGQVDTRFAYPLQATLRNSIFVGSRNDELILNDASERQDPTLFQLQLQNSIVRVRDLLTAQSGRYANFFETYCQGCINVDRETPLFLNQMENDYHLDTMSVALDKALLLPDITVDLENKPRGDMPDIGAYELQK